MHAQNFEASRSYVFFDFQVAEFANYSKKIMKPRLLFQSLLHKCTCVLCQNCFTSHKLEWFAIDVNMQSTFVLIGSV